VPKAKIESKAPASVWRCPPSGLPPEQLLDLIRNRGVISGGCSAEILDRNLIRRVVTRLFVELRSMPAPEYCDRSMEIFEISERLDLPASEVVKCLRETIRHYEALLPGRGRGNRDRAKGTTHG